MELSTLGTKFQLTQTNYYDNHFTPPVFHYSLVAETLCYLCYNACLWILAEINLDEGINQHVATCTTPFANVLSIEYSHFIASEMCLCSTITVWRRGMFIDLDSVKL